MHNELDEVKVITIASENPQTVSVNDPLSKVSDKMLRVKIHSVTVVDDKRKPIGVISSLDLVKTTFMSTEKAKDIPVARLIEGQKLSFIFEEMTLRDALNLMVDKNVRSLPIMSMEEKLIAIITMSDIMKFVREKL